LIEQEEAINGFTRYHVIEREVHCRTRLPRDAVYVQNQEEEMQKPSSAVDTVK
jgi:hypothetical protein